MNIERRRPRNAQVVAAGDGGVSAGVPVQHADVRDPRVRGPGDPAAVPRHAALQLAAQLPRPPQRPAPAPAPAQAPLLDHDRAQQPHEEGGDSGENIK